MPNILKRPMFKRGGSTQGEGITSGLTKRENFQEKGMSDQVKQTMPDKTKMMMDFINKRIEQRQPTTKQSIGDFLTAFGSTAGKARTLGEALGGAASGFSALQQQRKARVDKYANLLDQTLLNQLGKMDKATATAVIKNATEYARVNYQNYPGDTKEQKVANAYKSKIDQLLSPQRAGESLEMAASKRAKSLLDAGDVDNVANSQNAARLTILVERGEIKMPDKNQTITGYFAPGDLIVKGNKGMINKKTPGFKIEDFELDFPVGKNFIDPRTQTIYYHQGGGTFLKVYP